MDSKVLIPHRQLNKGRVDAAVYPKVMHRKYKSLISYGNKFRDFAKNPAAMSGIAIGQVREERASQSSDREVPAYGRAYIVRQFKRSEEIDLMRQVYGRKFIQVSAYGSALERREVLIQKIKAYDASPKSDTECEKQALDLIAIDHNQKDDEHGQRLSDVFHLGDVFVNGIDRANARATIARFIRAFFGHNGESPTKDEYGLYTATAASLRSIDLSRQIGAAIFSSNGEIVSMGCNEVPKRGGGTYWCDDPDPPHRDFERGFDANQERRAEIIFDLLQRMNVEGLLSDKIKRLKNMQERVNKIMSRRRVRDSQVMDIIEFGRIIHAEMSAISDAARLGRATLHGTLFSTTFPCHMCARHIVAAGITRVVFLEPYPKSYAQKLHEDSITFEADHSGKVLFQPFIGISPRRYRDIFERRKKRKGEDGKIILWQEGKPAPLVEDRSSLYIDNEPGSIYVTLRKFRENATRTRRKARTRS